jgi:hypothetical protein
MNPFLAFGAFIGIGGAIALIGSIGWLVYVCCWA